MPQTSLPCVVYRGGTSRGLFFHRKDLPGDVNERNRIFLEGIDAYNPSQVNGLGGTTSSTSKVCVISPSSRPDADVDWTFYQIGVGVPVVDDKGTCGNLMAAVGAFAVDEGLVKTEPGAETAQVKVFNTNIHTLLDIEVPVVDGKARVSGDYQMPGVIKPGALIRVAITHPGGEKTGKLLPLGLTHGLKRGGQVYETSFLDLINPFVYISAADLGLSGAEPASAVANDPELLARLNSIRDYSAAAAGMAADEKDAQENSPAVPKIAVVAKPQDYVTTSGKAIKKADVDILVKVLSMGKLHRTSPASGLYNLASAVLLPGTIPNRLAELPGNARERVVRIGHPDGVAEVRATLRSDAAGIDKVGMDRTARRIIKGELFIPINA